MNANATSTGPDGTTATRASEPSRYTFHRDVPVTAGLVPRGLALLVDLVIVAFLSWIVAILVLTLGLQPTSGTVRTFTLLVVLLELPLGLLYWTLAEGLTGTTVGKRLLRLHVVHIDGEPISVFDAFTRTLLRFLWVAPGIGQVFMLLDAALVHFAEMNQRIGDLAADTVVAEIEG